MGALSSCTRGKACLEDRPKGRFFIATNLAQVIYPDHTLSNVWRGPGRGELHMTGKIDQPPRTPGFCPWQSGTGGSGDAGSGAEARIEGDRAYVRQEGGEWQDVEDLSVSFAPDKDPLAFLGGIKDIADCELPARAPAPDSGAIASAGVAVSEPGAASRA